MQFTDFVSLKQAIQICKTYLLSNRLEHSVFHHHVFLKDMCFNFFFFFFVAVSITSPPSPTFLFVILALLLSFWWLYLL
ncbi:hypothetical protein Sjap_017164 [Stephania japonica]|uniref:Uncharacterized protein n=1 Tax=Stephania japonica TaxID=461633 RepID=A0AAP0NJK1_9MAGN